MHPVDSDAVAAQAAHLRASTLEGRVLLDAWRDPRWPDVRDGIAPVAALERARLGMVAADGLTRPVVRRQDPALLADRLHYEVRIAEAGVLATREHSAHDFFNALAWLRHPELKHALNRRQVRDIARVGPRVRTRAQSALTHFDEAGAIVWCADDALLQAWDRHDWVTLFVDAATAWSRSIAVTVFGHALVEHVHAGRRWPVAKALAVRVAALDAPVLAGGLLARSPLEPRIARAIEQGDLLADPQSLRPLPLGGLPGWTGEADARGVVGASCFRPLRAGRRYPAPFDARVAEPARELFAGHAVSLPFPGFVRPDAVHE